MAFLLRIRRAAAAFEGAACSWSPTVAAAASLLRPSPSPSPLPPPHLPSTPTVAAAASLLRPPLLPHPHPHASPRNEASGRPLPLLTRLPLVSKTVRGGSPLLLLPQPPPRHQSAPPFSQMRMRSYGGSPSVAHDDKRAPEDQVPDLLPRPLLLLAKTAMGGSGSPLLLPQAQPPPRHQSGPTVSQMRSFGGSPLMPHDQGVPEDEDRILHNHRVLMPIWDRCIDEGSFHFNFDPVEYCKCYPVMEVVPIPGTDPQEFFHKPTDDGLILFRSLPSFLYTLHETGNCLSPYTPLTLDNVAITGAGKFRVRLDLVTFIPIGSFEGGGIIADYENAAIVLKDLLEACYGGCILKKLPDDIRLWFFGMQRCGRYDGPIICNHASLLPLRNRANVFMKIYKLILTDIWAEDKKMARWILDGVPVSYRRKGWYEIASGNKELRPWWSYQTYHRSRISFFHLHRNAYCHRENSPVDIDLLMYSLYPEMLCSAQERLWASKKRGALSLENDFGSN